MKNKEKKELYVIEEYNQYLKSFNLPLIFEDESNKIYADEHTKIIINKKINKREDKVITYKIFIDEKEIERTEFVFHNKKYMDEHYKQENNIIIRHHYLNKNLLNHNIYFMINSKLIKGHEETYEVDSSLTMDELLSTVFKSKRKIVKNEVQKKGKVIIKK